MHAPASGHVRHLAAAIIAVLVAVAGMFLGAAPASAASHHVTISTYAYHPGSLTIAAGDTVTWTNLDSVAHDVTITRGPALFHSPMLSQGQSWSYTFTVAGPYTYICSVHPDMTATLTVTPAAPPTVVAATDRAAAAPATSPHPNAKTGATASAAAPTTIQAQSAPLDNGTRQAEVNPLLVVGGALCAVMIFCLLTIASRPIREPALVHEPATEEALTRVLPPPPPA